MPSPTTAPVLRPGVISDFSASVLGAEQIRLAWQGGTQDGYRLTRITSSGESDLPAPAATATGATDSLPAGVRIACYRLQALSGSGAPLRTSDTLCVSARQAFGAGPNSISIVFAQPNIALVAWGDVPGATSYVFLPLGTAGGQILPATTRFALHDTRGGLGCYVVAARSTLSVTGVSNFVCGLSR